MAWTSEDADRIRAALARGVMRVENGDQSITYSSPQQMLSVLAQIEAQLATAANPTRTSVSVARFGTSCRY